MAGSGLDVTKRTGPSLPKGQSSVSKDRAGFGKEDIAPIRGDDGKPPRKRDRNNRGRQDQGDDPVKSAQQKSTKENRQLLQSRFAMRTDQFEAFWQAFKPNRASRCSFSHLTITY